MKNFFLYPGLPGGLVLRRFPARGEEINVEVIGVDPEFHPVTPELITEIKEGLL
jgi:hypothetical protein